MKVTFVHPDYFETRDIHSGPQGRACLGSRRAPSGARNRALEKGRYRLEWKFCCGVDY